jgi:hypothetical protein
VNDGEKKSGFWTTLPGILTGVAALVTAIGGLALGLYQYGVLGAKRGNAAPTTISTTTPERASTEASSGQLQRPIPNPVPSTGGKNPATVVVTASDGTVTTLFAGNFRQTAQYDAQLHLLSGQAIAFGNIRSIEVVKPFSDHAQVNITLVDGRIIDGSLGAGSSIYGFGGENELGTFSITVDHLKQIVFRH